MVTFGLVPTTLRQQGRMARYALGHLGGSSIHDWLHHRGHVRRTLARWVDGDMESMQRPNAEAAFLSTPSDGLGAGLTRNGRVSVVLAPGGAGHQFPYYVDGGRPLQGAPPMAGSFAGLDVGDGPDWFWEREVSLAYRRGTGMVDLTYGGTADDPLRVRETAYVAPGSETLVRDLTVEAIDGVSREVEFVAHTRANANDRTQTFGVWESSPNELVADDDLRWRDRKGPTEVRVRLNRPATATARRVGGDEFTGGRTAGTYLEGRLRTSLSVPADGAARISVLLTAGESPTWDADLLEADQAGRQAAVSDWWNEWLPDADPLPDDEPDAGGVGGAVAVDVGGRANGGVEAIGSADAGVTRGVGGRGGAEAAVVDADVAVNAADDEDGPDLQALYRRSVSVIGALADPDTGSLAASPNLQPSYHPCWPRDAAFAAIAFARAGRPAPARAVLAEFLPRVQERDGSFKQCYSSGGQFAGVVHVEADQQPLFAWAVREVHRTIEDPTFLSSAWPAVRDALEYTVATVGDDGLLAPTPDIDEYPDAVRQSLWTNTWAYRGLLDGAAIAEAVGENPTSYEAAASDVGAALAREFFDGDGYVTHRDVRGDHRDLHSYDAVTIHPTGWAAAHSESERLLDDLRALARGPVEWVPGALLLATTLYHEGETSTAERLLERVAGDTTAAGHLVEEPTDGPYHHFASPLAWSHAAFVLAMEERAKADVG